MPAQPAKKELRHPLEHTIDFLKKLEKNNSFEWFKQNRDYYEATFLIPAQELVRNLGEELRKLSPDLHALPNIDKSIFRLHRDIRFSKNKLPFKTHLGILMWEGNDKKLEASGYYIQLEKSGLFLGSGTYVFPKDQLLKYREIVSDTKKANELLKILSTLEAKGYASGGKTLKKAPRGVPAEMMNDALRFTGLYVYKEIKPVPVELFENAEQFCFHHFKAMFPLHRWLMQNIYATGIRKR